MAPRVGPSTPDAQRTRAWHAPGLGWSPFARRYSGSRGFFPFLGLLRCFTSARFATAPYVFRRGRRDCSRQVAPSEIPGYSACLQLPGAYRSLPRPLKPAGAKTSPVHP